ncbi:B-cell receptor CD22-like [Esox lucius]|uniref:B-cell receptor CD22-like n=1 Tax=Esox lucius TaxID=8010 RepID=UPI0014774383|nr:B-cell receptor CD22-like [Esox lucius]
MALRTTGSVWVVFLWSRTVVLGQGDWDVTYSTQSICVLKWSAVELSCTYKYPSGHKVSSTFWFTKKYVVWNPANLLVDPDYRGRVTYRNDEKNSHTLIITDLRESDSAEYMFRFITDQSGWVFTGNPGITLSVAGLQVEVSPTEWSYRKILTCRTTCPLTGNPTYIWYKNGQQIDESSSPQYKDSVYSNHRDSYSCSVKGHEDLHSPTVCVLGQICNRVTYTKRRICVLKGSSVDISCTYVGRNTVTSSLWFSPKQSGRWRDKLIPEDLTTDPGYAGRVEYSNQESSRYRGTSTLRITDLREEDSAEYRFIFKTYNIEWAHSFPGTTLTVTDVVLEMEPTSVSEGNRVTLTCTTNCSLDPNPEYSWYKNGQPIENTNTNSTVHILSVSSEDAGRYSCGVKGHETLLSPEKTLDVTYSPKNPSVSVSPSGEIVEGSSVSLTCSSDVNPPVYKYSWYKKTVTSPKASRQTYSITNITSEDSGEYYCDAENKYGRLNSSSVSVDVHYGPKIPSVSVRLTVVVLVLILCLSGLIWFRKKSSQSTCDEGNFRDTQSHGQTDSSPVYDNVSDMVMTSTAAQTADTDNQDDLHYASVHYSSTVQLSQPQEEEVQYAAVKFICPSAATRPETRGVEEEPTVLYSTVNKTRTKRT